MMRILVACGLTLMRGSKNWAYWHERMTCIFRRQQRMGSSWDDIPGNETSVEIHLCVITLSRKYTRLTLKIFAK